MSDASDLGNVGGKEHFKQVWPVVHLRTEIFADLERNPEKAYLTTGLDLEKEGVVLAFSQELSLFGQT